MRLLYIAILIGLTLFFTLYSDNLSLIMLITAVIVPILLHIMLKISSAAFRVNTEGSCRAVRKSSGTEVLLTVENGSVFPLSCVTMNIRCLHRCGRRENIRSVTVPIPARSSEQISINISSDYCGRIECEITDIKLYDLLHLTSVTVREGIKCACVDFLPDGGFELSRDVISRLSSAENASFLSMRKRSPAASDPDELREYRDGDKLNRVAWKLCGKNDEIIVRDCSGNTGGYALIMADTASAAGDEIRADRLYECFYSAVRLMCEHELLLDSICSDGSFIDDITLTDKFSDCIRGIYGKEFSAADSALNTENRRYASVYAVSYSLSDDACNELKKRFGASEVCVISPENNYE